SVGTPGGPCAWPSPTAGSVASTRSSTPHSCTAGQRKRLRSRSPEMGGWTRPVKMTRTRTVLRSSARRVGIPARGLPGKRLPHDDERRHEDGRRDDETRLQTVLIRNPPVDQRHESEDHAEQVGIRGILANALGGRTTDNVVHVVNVKQFAGAHETETE